MIRDNKNIVNDQDIADGFADEFVKSFATFTGCKKRFATSLQVNLNTFQISAVDVFNALVNLDVSSATGMDQVPALFLKSTVESIFIPIYLLFRSSLDSDMFPDRWKTSRITPVHKNGPKSCFSNYRPIAIISVIPKIFEVIIAPQFSSSIRHVIDENQHGFLPGKSVETNLFLYTNHLFSAVSENLEIHSIYTDFSKAFDRVNHDLLIHKLEQYGVGPKVVRWLSSYLTGRKAQVSVRSSFSRSFEIPSGVPQGSHLGPMLFLMLVNDIGRSLTSPYLLFADDLKLYRSVCNTNDSDKLQDDLIALHSWCSDNDMSLNLNKCKSICFSKKVSPSIPLYRLENTMLDCVNTIRDLGVLFDSKLTFVSHIETVVAKANSMSGFIRRNCQDFTNTNALLTLYFSLVRSHLDYCALIWSPYHLIHIKRVESVQRRFMKFMYLKCPSLNNNLDVSDYVYTADYLGILSLQQRRIYLSLVFFFKIINGGFGPPSLINLVNFYVPQYGIRSSRLVSFGQCRTFYQLHCSPIRLARLANRLHSLVDFFGIPLQRFKSDLRRVLASARGGGLP